MLYLITVEQQTIISAQLRIQKRFTFLLQSESGPVLKREVEKQISNGVFTIGKVKITHMEVEIWKLISLKLSVLIY
jgi:hypothetical protein